jgi:hypothetical protein
LKKNITGFLLPKNFSPKICFLTLKKLSKNFEFYMKKMYFYIDNIPPRGDEFHKSWAYGIKCRAHPNLGENAKS